MVFPLARRILRLTGTALLLRVARIARLNKSRKKAPGNSLGLSDSKYYLRCSFLPILFFLLLAPVLRRLATLAGVLLRHVVRVVFAFTALAWIIPGSITYT
jgi:hypothetical protein